MEAVILNNSKGKVKSFQQMVLELLDICLGTNKPQLLPHTILENYFELTVISIKAKNIKLKTEYKS